MLKHWSFKYFIDKLKLIIYQRRNPNTPWFTKDAINFLSSNLGKTDVGLEYGSGRSTVWIGQRVGKLTSVEHDKKWYELVKEKLVKNKHKNVELFLRKTKQDYIKVADKFEKDSLGFIIVDGVWRADCANYSITKLKAGGIIVIDNSERYIPSDSNSPESIGQNKAPSREWMKFKKTIKNWHCVLTSNGVWDTAIYIKPY